MTAGLAPPPSASALRDLFAEIGDCKRIRSAGRRGSIAERAFAVAWRALRAGGETGEVMRAIVARGLAAARLGDLDDAKLDELGLGSEDRLAVLRRAFDEVAAPVDRAFAAFLRPALGASLAGGDAPDFVAALAAQPRAGATCPGKARLILEPPESHAEHCWSVAMLGVMLAPRYRADPAVVFLASLSHHLHNALMPDSGFSGEVLLDEHLAGVCEFATGKVLDQLSASLRAEVVDARTILADASTPEGRAFHAADVIDRVMQLSQHLRPASIRMETLLTEWELVHAGPVKAFHDDVLAEMGLA